MSTCSFYTLGCKSNQSETEQMKEILYAQGFNLIDHKQAADVAVINTCVVTQVAEKKSRHALRYARKLNSQAKIIATGCFSELFPEEIKKIDPHIIILTNKDKKNIDQFTKNLRSNKFQQTFLSNRIRNYLMIEDGCENYCTYCIVPYARGKVKSKPFPAIITEAKKLISYGTKEIVLTGINLGAYGKDLPTVIKELSKLAGLERIRLSSIEPMYITDELIKAISTTPKVCPHLHIPLQSGDDEILKNMNRNYTAKNFLDLIKKTRKSIPNVAINTDIIVGFPGETDKQFQNTVKLINKIKFSRIHVFKYSKRKLTKAEGFPQEVPSQVINQRSKKIIALAQKHQQKYHRQHLGKKIEILMEQPNQGLTSTYMRVMIKNSPDLMGKIVSVKAKKINEDLIIGEVCGFAKPENELLGSANR